MIVNFSVVTNEAPRGATAWQAVWHPDAGGNHISGLLAIGTPHQFFAVESPGTLVVQWFGPGEALGPELIQSRTIPLAPQGDEVFVARLPGAHFNSNLLVAGAVLAGLVGPILFRRR